jgi:prepilin-type N-terminal cleavage/methylation domain-containing protein
MNKMRRMLKGSRGFTLIELIVVIVIIGILAIIAIPKFLDLTNQAKASATKASLGAVRSTLYMIYANNAANGAAAFPSSLVGTDFASGALPTNQCNSQNGIGVVAAAPTGTTESATNGFWYIVATGQAGAYAKAGAGACIDTTTW